MDYQTTERLKLQSRASNELFRLFGGGKEREIERLAIYGAEKWLEMNPEVDTLGHSLALYLRTYGEDSFLTDGQYNSNRYARVKRLRERVGDYVRQGNGYFITLTFNDTTMASTTPETRRKYVTSWCKYWLNSYVANIDFGGKKGREHYHCIGNGETYLTDRCTFLMASRAWQKYGAIKMERIHGTSAKSKELNESEKMDISITRTCKYITKLTSHAIKESTGKAWNLIYSADGGSCIRKYTHNLYEERYDSESGEWIACHDDEQLDWSHWNDWED